MSYHRITAVSKRKLRGLYCQGLRQQGFYGFGGTHQLVNRGQLLKNNKRIAKNILLIFSLFISEDTLFYRISNKVDNGPPKVLTLMLLSAFPACFSNVFLDLYPT